jgi:hypothetical protein
MNKFKALSICLLLIIISGCATTDVTKMTPESNVSDVSFSGSANILVVGSNEAIAKNSDIKLAIEGALANSQLFNGDETKFRINVNVLSIKNPMMGINLKSELRIKWQLIDISENKIVWEDNLTNDYTATMSDSLVAVTRLRIANEGVIRENIQLAIDEMIALIKAGEAL